MTARSPFRWNSWVGRFLVADTIVYVLAIAVFTGHWFTELVAFAPRTAWRAPWTFLSYMFVHLGFLHLALNMLMLYVFGPAVEARMGRAFPLFYLLCGLGGAAGSFVVAAFTTVDPFVGASAAVLGVALAYAYYWPDAEMYVFPLPVPVEARWLVAVLAAIDVALAVYLAESGGGDGTAHLSYIGGLITGFAYLSVETWAAGRGRQPISLRKVAAVLVHPAANAEAPVAPLRREATPGPAQDEVDRVLDKISANGISSLTPEERRFLDDQSRRMRDR
jgi:membrane associated rhomboid family serine protease